MGGYMEVSSKQALVEKYLEFKQLMLKIDPAEEDEGEDSFTHDEPFLSP